MRSINNRELEKKTHLRLLFKYSQNITLAILSMLLILSCHASKPDKKNVQNQNNEPNVISFLMFSIYKDTISSTNLVTLIKKTESAGKIKKQRNFLTKNYLTIYSYSGKIIVDSLLIEHPLYKHLEYVDANKNFVVKDTIINSADFFVRLQGKFNHLKIVETLQNKPAKELNLLKKQTNEK